MEKYKHKLQLVLKIKGLLQFFWKFTTSSEINVWKKLLGYTLVIGYVISPLDAVPDILLPFGIVDDAGVLALAVSVMWHVAPSSLKEQHPLNYDN